MSAIEMKTAILITIGNLVSLNYSLQSLVLNQNPAWMSAALMAVFSFDAALRFQRRSR
jgi:hypothetical protein